MGEPAGTELVVLEGTNNPLHAGDGGIEIREAGENESNSVASVHGTAGVADRGNARRQPARGAPRRATVSRYARNAEKYKALLSKVAKKSSARAKLMSVQGVLFAFTFMMSTFETSNR